MVRKIAQKMGICVMFKTKGEDRKNGVIKEETADVWELNESQKRQ